MDPSILQTRAAVLSSCGVVPTNVFQVTQHPTTETASSEPEKSTTTAVLMTDVTFVGYTGYAPQQLELKNCVVRLGLDSFYGKYRLLDSDKRILAVSEDQTGIMHLTRKHMKHDAGKIWFDVASFKSPEYQGLCREYGVGDPGLPLGDMCDIYIEFLEASDNHVRYPHIPLRVKRYALWNDTTHQFDRHEFQ